ncbi:hypothetical protein DFH09DRAFT_1132269 [Mycena vulgaris]|nr:hypothetical protein DFH09DRAFT_1132269 [Mycena vulgaris]
MWSSSIWLRMPILVRMSMATPTRRGTPSPPLPRPRACPRAFDAFDAGAYPVLADELGEPEAQAEVGEEGRK